MIITKCHLEIAICIVIDFVINIFRCWTSFPFYDYFLRRIIFQNGDFVGWEGANISPTIQNFPKNFKTFKNSAQPTHLLDLFNIHVTYNTGYNCHPRDIKITRGKNQLWGKEPEKHMQLFRSLEF